MGELPHDPISDRETEVRAVDVIKALDGLTIGEAVRVLRIARDLIEQTHLVDAEWCREQMVAADFVQPDRSRVAEKIKNQILGLEDPR